MVENDTAAVAQAQIGDSDAFGVLVERHSPGIFRLAYRMTGNEHDAEEVVQETFLKAYRQLHRFESRSSFGTWLHQIACNCSFDLVRARRRHQDRRQTEESDGSDPLLRLVTADPGPDRKAFSAEVQSKIAAALALLGPGERAAFVLRHFEGMSIEEVGKVLGTRTSATKHSVFRAVHKLRLALEPVVRSAR